MYYITQIAVRIFMYMFFGLRYTGVKGVPREGPLMICSNHLSNWDPPLIGCIMPRNVSFMAKEELFRSKVWAFFLRLLKAFPVKRGGSDYKAVRTAIDIIKNGGALLMFPEGTRQKNGSGIQPFERGVGLIALKSNAVVLPVVISGSYKIFKRTHVKMGEPFSITEELARLHEEQLGGGTQGSNSERSDVDLAVKIIRDRMIALTHGLEARV